jgi:hypothetical protein
LTSLNQPAPDPCEQEQQLADAEQQHDVAHGSMIPLSWLADTRPSGAP